MSLLGVSSGLQTERQNTEPPAASSAPAEQQVPPRASGSGEAKGSGQSPRLGTRWPPGDPARSSSLSPRSHPAGGWRWIRRSAPRAVTAKPCLSSPTSCDASEPLKHAQGSWFGLCKTCSLRGTWKVKFEGSHLSPLCPHSPLLRGVPHTFRVGSGYRLFPAPTSFWEHMGTPRALHPAMPATRNCISQSLLQALGVSKGRGHFRTPGGVGQSRGM